MLFRNELWISEKRKHSCREMLEIRLINSGRSWMGHQYLEEKRKLISAISDSTVPTSHPPTNPPPYPPHSALTLSNNVSSTYKISYNRSDRHAATAAARKHQSSEPSRQCQTRKGSKPWHIPEPCFFSAASAPQSLTKKRRSGDTDSMPSKYCWLNPKRRDALGRWNRGNHKKTIKKPYKTIKSHKKTIKNHKKILNNGIIGQLMA